MKPVNMSDLFFNIRLYLFTKPYQLLPGVKTKPNRPARFSSNRVTQMEGHLTKPYQVLPRRRTKPNAPSGLHVSAPTKLYQTLPIHFWLDPTHRRWLPTGLPA